MFDPNKSKLAGQVTKLERLKSGEVVTLDEISSHIYKMTTMRQENPSKDKKGIPYGPPPPTFNPEESKQLTGLFKTNVKPSSLECFLTAGYATGAGVFSFADFQEDPQVGLYLCYHMCVRSFLGVVFCDTELYLGVYENPPNYDDIFVYGVKDFVYLNNYTKKEKGFGLTTGRDRFLLFRRKTSRVARELFKKLQSD